MNRDFAEILSELSAAGADFLVVGAHALAVHGVPRATGDLDIWVRPTGDNADRVINALRRFGAPLFDLTRDDLTRPDTVFQIGMPPMRVDILSGISGVNFTDEWDRRIVVTIEGQDVPACRARTSWPTSERLDVQRICSISRCSKKPTGPDLRWIRFVTESGRRQPMSLSM